MDSFHEITGLDHQEWFCTHDPIGHKLGSGGGTDWLLRAAWQTQGAGQSFDEWLAADKRLLLHAGGQSRRLPSYAPSGKVLTPIPVFRWERGQRLSQDLLSLQVPLYERIMAQAPSSLHTMIVSGDVLIRATEPLQPIPEADVVCYGLWLNPETASHHGVFVSSHERPDQLERMLQKPSVETLSKLSETHFYLTDIGVWLLSDRAVRLLMKRSEQEGKIKEYDLYSEFGCALGSQPDIQDEELNSLRVAILPLPGGEFYHFGTSHELLSSPLAIQNLVNDQREIMHHSLKPHPAMFVQNAITRVRITAENQNLGWRTAGWASAGPWRARTSSRVCLRTTGRSGWTRGNVWIWCPSAKRTGWCAPTAITTLLQGRNSRRSSFPSLIQRRRRACCCASCWARRRRRKRRRPMRRLGS